jgi:nitroreductase
LDLAAPSFALGTCWAGFLMMAASHWPPLQNALSLPEGYACFGAMMIGYPKYKYQRLPLRKEPDIMWQGSIKSVYLRSEVNEYEHEKRKSQNP